MPGKALRRFLKTREGKKFAQVAAEVEAEKSNIQEVLREQEVGQCIRCRAVLPWRYLNDLSTQEYAWVYCLRCTQRAENAQTIRHLYERGPGLRCLVCRQYEDFPLHFPAETPVELLH